MRNIILVAIVSIFAGAALSLHIWEKEETINAIQGCLANQGITENDLRSFHAALEDPTKATRGARCFAKCLIENYGFYKDGVMDKEAVLQEFAEKHGTENVERVFDACTNQEGDEECEKEFNILVCVQNQMEPQVSA